MRLRWVGLVLVGVWLPTACGEDARSPTAGEGGEGGEGPPPAGAPGGGEAPQAGKSGEGGALPVGAEGGSGALVGGAGSGSGALGGAGPSEAGAGGETASAGAPGTETSGGEGGADNEPLQDANLVFVTSKSYSPKAFGGLDAADDECRALAAAANLPGTFVAWLSSSSLNARDRLGDARGWRNTRQYVVADEVSDLLAGQIYFPIAFDENGDAVTGLVATGTAPDGSATAPNCEDWSTDSDAVALVTGEPTAGAELWTRDSDGSSCADEYHLYCFQIDHLAALFPTPSQGRTVFVSAQPFELGAEGRALADELCAAEAAAEDFDGTFVALLPTSTESALARLVNPTRPWVRPDGMVVASSTSWFELFPFLGVAITEQANGVHVGGARVFGAADIGEKADLHCEDWTNPQASVPAVVFGITGYTDDRWYGGETGACSESARVLCVEK